MSDIAKGVLGSLIAAALIAAGGWLTTVMVTEEVALFINANQVKLGTLVVWDLSFSNYNDYAIDEVEITVPAESNIATEFDRKTELKKDDSTGQYVWRGELEKHGILNALAIFNSPNMIFSDDRLKDFAHAKYRVRDDTTGTLKWQTIPVLRGSEPTTSRAILKIFWFLLPIGMVASASFGWLAIVRYARNRSQQTVLKQNTEQKFSPDGKKRSDADAGN